MSVSIRHRWGEKTRFAEKTERQCARCEMFKVGLKQDVGFRIVYSTQFFRDGEQIDCKGTPPCDARLEVAA